MDDDEKLKLVLTAVSDCEGVVIVVAGVAYEGVISSFYGGKFEATVRVCGDPSATARFTREFTLSAVEDIALIDQPAAEPVKGGAFVPPWFGGPISSIPLDRAVEVAQRQQEAIWGASDIMSRAIRAAAGKAVPTEKEYDDDGSRPADQRPAPGDRGTG